MKDAVTIKFVDLPHADKMEINLTPNQAKFYNEKELDGVVFKELVDAEFISTIEQYMTALPEDALALMGAWDMSVFRGVLRKFRAEHDTNELLLEDIEIADLDKLAKTVDFVTLEHAMSTLPDRIVKLSRAYRAARGHLAIAYSELTGRELSQRAFGNASSLYKLRAEVVQHISE